MPDLPSSGQATRPGGPSDRSAWDRVDPALFVVWAAACVLYAAVTFYGSMHAQTGGTWSAPLDDVFIHFDYARAAARGYPFQWSEGNGYSSGNTSLLYPFVLSIGYLAGFRGLLLMKWAAVVACVSTLGFLLAASRLFETPRLDPYGRWGKYLLPPAVLSLGALDWTLFSGMENAFHLGVWGLCLLPALSVASRAASGDRSRLVVDAWLGGLAGALLYATRPESVVCIAVLAVASAWAALRIAPPSSSPWAARRFAATIAIRFAAPAVAVLVAQSACNRILTGEWAAAGAIVKLGINNPYTPPAEKFAEYLHFLEYVVLRNTQHHFADDLPWGWLVPLVALVPLVPRRTRVSAVVLWAQVVGWLALVSLNGQVRWQNERYTMPAVAWLFVLAAMGIAELLRPVVEAAMRWRSSERPPPRALSASFAMARGVAAVAAVATYVVHQAPNMRDQIWFFGRACRNIRDQHITAGELLRKMEPSRVLVGDAGALIYTSDRPGLDLIGLGGYHDLPFARAGVHGLGASLELIERIDPTDRPDVMALYPSWWGGLPSVFGRRITEVPVSGNVICGGAEKVIYRADWSALDRAGRPRSLAAGEEVIDQLDVADLVSEREHDYEFPHPAAGWVAWRVLPDPWRSTRDLFDAGRVIPDGTAERARVRLPEGDGRLIVRTVPDRPCTVEAAIDGRVVGTLSIAPLDAKRPSGWLESSLPLAGVPSGRGRLELRPVGCAWTNHHVWIAARRPGEVSRR